MMVSSFLAIIWLSISRASRFPSWQYLAALVSSFWCSFSTPMLQQISIRMYSPQCRFSSSARRPSLSPPSLAPSSASRTSTSRPILSAWARALRISSRALSCLPISLRMAALLRQLGTMSQWCWRGCSFSSPSSRLRAWVMALRESSRCLCCLRMQLKLLKVRIVSLAREACSAKWAARSGCITRSTAFEMNFTLPPSSWSAMFCIASLFTFCTKLVTSWDSVNWRDGGSGLPSAIRLRWISFSSQRMQSMLSSCPLARILPTTPQMYPIMAPSPMFLGASNSTESFSCTTAIENRTILLLSIDGQLSSRKDHCQLLPPLAQSVHSLFLSARMMLTLFC